MAVEKKNQAPKPIPLVKDYIVTLRRHVLAISLLTSVLVAITSIFILLMSGALPHDSPVAWVIGIAIGVITFGGGMLIFAVVIPPISTLLRAIAHASGEQIAGSIPNPHDSVNTKSGLGIALQAVYLLDKTGSTQDANTSSSLIDKTPIDRMHGAIITLDANRNVKYASNNSPLHTVNGALQPQLLFNGADSLDEWLNECEESTVKAEKHWRRVPDRPADTDEQRLFDVYASYEKGSPHETVLTLVDFTDNYQVDEEDLNFIAFAAHELRGPITVIRGYIDVLQDELSAVIADDQRELFHRLSVSASRLSSYINNILNTSRYDRRHLTLTLVPDTMSAVYATIADDMALRASSQNRLLSVTIPTDLPQIAADKASLSEVISNLVDNAIKYSNEGGSVTVSAAQNGEYVDIRVEDQGIGMPPSVTKNIFQKFYRSHRSRETVAGSGIGLYVSKAIVESHGGMIRVQSKEGQGTSIVVSIPTYASVAEKLAAADGNNLDLIKQGSGWIKNHSMYRG